MPPQPPAKPREIWIDVARCVAMAFIMSLHAGAAPHALNTPVGGAICLFFVLAGYFTPRQARAAALRALRLGVAWLLWSLLSLGLYIAVHTGTAWDWAHAFGIGAAAYNTPLWFLKDLCVFQLIMAALMALRLLPRYGWFTCALLAAFTYAAEPQQHEALRFSWLPAVLLGYALRGSIPTPSQLRSAAVRHSRLIIAAGALLILQHTFYPRLLHSFGIRATSCALPIQPLIWATWYALVAIGITALLPRTAGVIALAGSCMLFIYAGHVPAYSPFYHIHMPPTWGTVIMLGLIPALCAAHAALARLLPGITRLLTAR